MKDEDTAGDHRSPLRGRGNDGATRAPRPTERGPAERHRGRSLQSPSPAAERRPIQFAKHHSSSLFTLRSSLSCGWIWNPPLRSGRGGAPHAGKDTGDVRLASLWEGGAVRRRRRERGPENHSLSRLRRQLPHEGAETEDKQSPSPAAERRPIQSAQHHSSSLFTLHYSSFTSPARTNARGLASTGVPHHFPFRSPWSPSWRAWRRWSCPSAPPGASPAAPRPGR